VKSRKAQVKPVFKEDLPQPRVIFLEILVLTINRLSKQMTLPWDSLPILI
jgi:hypothetical protein